MYEVCGNEKGPWKAPHVNYRVKTGRDDWIRTSDPLTPSQVRYQAAPHPDAAIVPRMDALVIALLYF